MLSVQSSEESEIFAELRRDGPSELIRDEGTIEAFCIYRDNMPEGFVHSTVWPG